TSGPGPTAGPTSTAPPPGGPGGCAVRRPQSLFCEDFESRRLNAFGDVHNTGVFRFVNAPVTSGRSALEARIASGTLGDNYANAFFADSPLRSGGPAAQQSEVYFQGRVRYGSGFDLSAGKMFILNAFEDWNAGYPGPNSFAPYYVTLQ